MSHFLQNLIGRHQEVGVSREVSHKVQPRPKSKYESDTGPGFFVQNDLNNGSDFTPTARSGLDSGSYFSHHDQDAGSIKTAESEQSLRHTQVTTQHVIDKPVTQPDFSHHIDGFKEQIKTATQPPGRKSSVQETQTRANKTESYKPTKDPREFPEITRHFLSEQQSQHADAQRANESGRGPAPDADNNASASEINHRIQNIFNRLNGQQSQHADDQSTNKSQHEPASNIDNNAPSNEINQRIQTILHRLNSQQLQHTNGQSTNKSQHEPALDTDNNAPASVAPLPLSFTESTADFPQPAVKVKEKSTENRSKQRESHQAGLLQIPNWLTEMQVNLNNRWKQVNTQAEPEPMINVTIGRVEVKAVQTESAKQPKTRNKPSGVMGLDDYLKQREGRGTR